MLIKSKNLKDAMLQSFDLLETKGEIRKPRGMTTKELTHVQIEVDNPRGRIAKIPDRNYNLAFNIAEFLTYVAGINSVEYISQFNDNIAQFSDNGIAFYGSYGERLKNHIPKLIEKLSNSQNTRQAVLNIYESKDAFEDTNDTPCTIALDFKIRNGKLDLHTFMRSNDLVWGFQYDMFNFTLLQEVIANSLGIDIGKYYHTATSFHIYKRHWKFFDKDLSQAQSVEMVTDKAYSNILATAKNSYRYLNNYYLIDIPEDKFLQVLNYYNYKKEVGDHINLLNNNDWAFETYHDGIY